MSNIIQPIQAPQSSAALTARPQRRGVMLLLALIAAVLTGLAVAYSWRQAALFSVGCLFGLTLYHASFGFASAYRHLLVRGETRGVLAQLLMLAIATLLFTPLILNRVGIGAEAPVAMQAMVGAFLFGIGMQLGSGCACGTLYAIGGGSGMMLFTLSTFCLSSFAASLSDAWWANWPRWGVHSFIGAWGAWGSLAQVLILVAIAIGVWCWRKPQFESFGLRSWRDLVFGPWSVVLGGIVLAGLNALTVWLAGRPWGVTWGFTLWTAKLATWVGWDPNSSVFWQQPFPAQALQSNLFSDITSIMNLGIILGAALAATLAGRLSLRRPPTRLAIVGALVGGVLMGYGARMAFGCNVGAYFSGIASTSAHGWLWIGFAIAGSWLGVKLRPHLGLGN